MKWEKAAFFTSLLTSLLAAFTGFLALADMIQYLVAFPREFTFITFRFRFPLMTVAIATFVSSVFLGFKFKFVSKKLLLAYLVLFVGALVGGFITPTYIMFRSQHYSAKFVSIEEAAELLPHDEEVLVLEIDGDARAYPHIWITRPHIAGGVVGGQNVVMTYCGLSHLGQAYKNDVAGKRLHLKVMTQLENNLVMFDANTQEPIQQIYGTFAHSGKKMTPLATTVMPLESFKNLYPEGKVFYNPPADNPVDYLTRKFMMNILYGDGAQFDINNPDPEFPTIEYTDRRIRSKEQVYGVFLDGEAIAYTLDYIKRHDDVVVEKIGQTTITVKYFPEYDFVDMFYGDVKDVNPYGFDLGGTKLQRVSHANKVLWIIWSNFYKSTAARVK